LDDRVARFQKTSNEGDFAMWNPHSQPKPRVKRARNRFFQPRVEILEDRWCPSGGGAQWQDPTLASFNGGNGSSPDGGLVMDGNGNLYGTTSSGGAYSDGTVFEYVPGSGTITTLASFNGTNGSSPWAGLIMDSSGNLYGTTNAGGVYGDGTVFEVVQGSGAITTLASFNGTNGANPYCTLLMDGSGNLYGTTRAGGAGSNGTVFEVAQGSGTIAALASFSSWGSGNWGPTCGVIMDGSGNLYGTVLGGGGYGRGYVFELTRGSSTITTLASFNLSNGQNPRGALIMDGNGNLYGSCIGGGAYGGVFGTLFEVAQGSGTITALASFNGSNGKNPGGALLMDSNGNLYGTTREGGDYGSGTVFEIAQGSGTITTLLPFNGSNGANPWCPLLMDASGNLYGTTPGGGANGQGTIFEVQCGGARYSFSGFSSATAGQSGQFTVTVQNPDGSTNTGYTGTIHFASSDARAVLPADYTFTAGDAGVHTFSSTLYTAGSQFITGFQVNSPIIGQIEVTVTPAAVSSLTISGYPSSTVAGTSNSFTATANDPYGNVVTGYLGTVSFSSSDHQAALPANYTFQGSDNGAHTFSATLITAGSQSITATDTGNGSLTGTQSGITVTPGAATHFGISAPSSVKKGVAFSVTVTALDAYGNVATGYGGTVNFTSSDRQAKLPANYTFVATDAGVHTFSVTLNTTGTQSLTVKDTAKKSTISGTASIQVSTASVEAQLQGASAVSTSKNTAALLPDQVLWEDLVTTLFAADSWKRDLP
jgi:uncharacterized repeat protein (TIGR03803 family)